ncbi:MAG: M16 family metallopeptidase, partial [Gammaproteobacteria bacterium]
VGSTGLSHFLEHMAFRATKNFPNVVSPIYAAGGEWHGYTSIDQTTYYETVPRRYFDLVLQIQADRMHNALIRAEEVEAERGSVMTELRGYENDPASLLNDAVQAV